MLFTRLVLPEGSADAIARHADPGGNLPRRHGNAGQDGSRAESANGRAHSPRAAPRGTVSRYSSSIGAQVHRILIPRSTTLSPWSALMGIESETLSMPTETRAVASTARQRSPPNNPARSILLTAATMWRVPRRGDMHGTRLGQNAFARIDQDDSHVGCGCARGHVARVLFMTGRVGDDDSGREVAVSDVDRDALLPLGPTDHR